MCPGSSDPVYIVTYYIKWVTTFWTYCRGIKWYKMKGKAEFDIQKSKFFSHEIKIFRAIFPKKRFRFRLEN